MSHESKTAEGLLSKVKQRDPNQCEFIEAVQEVLDSLSPLFEKYPKYLSVVETICEPERVIQFRFGKKKIIRFELKKKNVYVYVYRFHPSVNLSIIKFLGFEQIFKNALTGLPMGGGKGGSDFDPKGKSDGEVLRFCQSFTTELARYIGADTDVPAGDIGVGGREVGFMFGQWKRLTSLHTGVLTGKGLLWGGSNIRPEATGYGLVYIVDIALKHHKDEIKGKRIAISGKGNVAEFAAERALQLGAIVVSLSDSDGSVIEEKGFTFEQFTEVRKIEARRGRIKDYVKLSKTAKYYEHDRPWKHVKCDIALPCATQNEVNKSEAETLVKNGCKYVAEGANMPSDPEAIAVFKKGCTFFIPAK
ncbi:hypothetical protein RFI_10368, partial [Reticulomyxa filosa]